MRAIGADQIVSACANVARRLVGSPTDPHIPGMRVEERLGYHLWPLGTVFGGASEGQFQKP